MTTTRVSQLERIEPEKGVKKTKGQFNECQGYGHFKVECLTVKKREQLKLFEYKEYGHIKAECVGMTKRKENLFVNWSESDSDDSDGEELLNFVAYLGVIE